MTELQDFAEELGLSVESLVRLGIGWSDKHRAWSFPMRGADHHVCGIRLRSWIGRKWAIRGSREGLFVPTGLDFTCPLVVCEGPTDTAAMTDLRFEAIGRPSCLGGVKLLVDLVRNKKPPAVVILADGDTPGRRGAEALASDLASVCRSVRVVQPPAEIKDCREWKLSGATHDDIQAVIDAASPMVLAVTRRNRATFRKD